VKEGADEEKEGITGSVISFKAFLNVSTIQITLFSTQKIARADVINGMVARTLPTIRTAIRAISRTPPS
jgi:hypothetical protein